MLIAYFSQTGNVETFVNKTDFEVLAIKDGSEVANKKFVLVTRTTGRGMVPKPVLTFLESNKENLVGVSASGNKNWADTFCFAADVLAQQFNVPALSTFENEGTDEDIKVFTNAVKAL